MFNAAKHQAAAAQVADDPAGDHELANPHGQDVRLVPRVEPTAVTAMLEITRDPERSFPTLRLPNLAPQSKLGGGLFTSLKIKITGMRPKRSV